MSSASVVRKDQRAVVPDDFLYFSGDDFTTLEFIEIGSHGVVTISGNVVPSAVEDENPVRPMMRGSQEYQVMFATRVTEERSAAMTDPVN